MLGIGHRTPRRPLVAGLLLWAACATAPEPAPPAPTAPPPPAEDAAAVEARQQTEAARARASARTRREAELVELVASANLIAMPELARARIRTASMGEIARLRFEGGDVTGALEAVTLALESAAYAGDARLTPPLRDLRFVILHYAALDSAKKGDTSRSLELFDTIAGLPGLTSAQRALAGGDRLLVMESQNQVDPAGRDAMIKGALARMLGIDEAPSRVGTAQSTPDDLFAMSGEALRVAVARDIGREVAESQLPSSGGGVAAETGRFDPAAVVQIVSANKGSISACYSQSLRGGGAERGKLELLVRVDPTGDVASAQIVTREFKSSPLGRCIADTVARWKFPPFTGEPRDVELPFVLDYMR